MTYTTRLSSMPMTMEKEMDNRPADVAAAQLFMTAPLTPGAGPVTQEQLLDAKRRLENLVEKKGLKRPVRSFMDDPDIVWRFGQKPDYTLADLTYLESKSRHHAEGSLEMIVENLVKTWEFERSHKVKLSQHMTPHKEFSLRSNNGRRFSNEACHAVGNYNALLDDTDPNLYDAANATWDSSHDAFHGAFPAFAWEVLDVYNGPPNVAFSWRHWGNFTGRYKDNEGDGRLVELFGFMVAQVSDDLKLMKCTAFSDVESFLKALAGFE